ncbi:cellulase family glycosylhydrolase [Corynebacterium heidelbergense]|nr:cellulase family glycosylhydrolase [Corynebacterium heidelbergense]
MKTSTSASPAAARTDHPSPNHRRTRRHLRTFTALTAGALSLASTSLPLTIPTAAAHAQTPPSAPAAGPVWPGPDGRPGATGRWITDPAGRTVIYHGENIVAKKAPYTPESIGFGDDDISFLKANGYNAVRLGIIWEAVEPQPGQYDEAYLDNIENTVRKLADAGLGTLLEVHQDAWSKRYGGEGAPDWASLDQGLPALPGGLIAAQFSPAVYQAVNNFFSNAPAADGVGIRTRFVNMWGHVSQRFASVPGVIGYSPINEPTPGWPFLLCQADLCPQPVVDRLISLNADVAKTVRQQDPRTTIWPMAYITTALGTHPQMGAPVDPNEVYPFNSYTIICNIGINLPGFVCDPHQRLNAARSREYAEQWNIPYAMTEFGAIGSPGVLTTQSRIADDNRIGWFHWNYGGPDHTTSAPSPENQAMVKNPQLPPTGDNVNTDNLTNTVRAYPKSVSGTPLSWGTDQNKVFTARWNGQRVDGTGSFAPGATSVITVPPALYPNGYTATVTGGRVLSEPGAMDLVIAADGPGDVNVSIAPR